MAEHDTTVMEHDVHHEQGAWDGGTEPFKASYGKLMMWYFLLSDAFTFSGFLIAYGSLRFSSPTWPVPDFVFSTAPFGLHGAPLIFVTFMSFLLIISSVTMVRAVQEGHRENKRGVVFWMLLTVLGGIGFLGCQAWEWTHFIVGTDDGGSLLDGSIFYGANLSMNQYGPPNFAALFFFITGFHGFHVFSGVVINFIIFYQTVVGKLEKRGHYEMVEKVG
ncbi:MAG: cytochrome oxidase subunit III, partial [Lewinella sp.]|uniref:cytochrome oxidase subunit III n=1 Tax=Lewinella sp. TaxID=2004506 RepID=UPI003D6A3AEA